MALQTPIIHCVIDQEPETFHDPNRGVAFAVNLSFEVPSDGEVGQLDGDEANAQQKFNGFLEAVGGVQFYLFRLLNGGAGLEPVSANPIDRISGGAHFNVANLSDWLARQKVASPYWTTKNQWEPDVAIEADSTGAAHRLRAIQGWNAPVGHHFGLTHILFIPQLGANDHELVVLPGFSGQPPQAARIVIHPVDAPNKVFDFSLGTLNGVGELMCRTTTFHVVPATPIHLPTINPVLTEHGYFKVDSDAEQFHRFLNHFEARASSLMAVNSALNSFGQDEEFERLFGLVKTIEGAEPAYHWGGMVWFIVARLLSALDNLVLALLQPVQGGSYNRVSDGAVLAPLALLLRERLGQIAEAHQLADAQLDGGHITVALRAVIAQSNPLVASAKAPHADLVRVLRVIYDLKPQTAGESISDARHLIEAALIRYEAGPRGESRLSQRVKEFVSASTVAQALAELEQPLQAEAGAETALRRLIQNAVSGANSPTLSQSIAKAYFTEINVANPPDGLKAAVTSAAEKALADYWRQLEGPFNGSDAVRQASSSAFVRNLVESAQSVEGEASSVRLKNAVEGCRYFSKRFRVEEEGGETLFAPLAATLAVPDEQLLSLRPPAADGGANPGDGAAGNVRDSLRAYLDKEFERAIEPMISAGSPTRFIPDNKPWPLAIQVAAKIGGDWVDEFSTHFNGIAVAIRRLDYHPEDNHLNRWAHAHLADLATGADGELVQGALHPTMPAISDGRGAMFIEYEGYPFANPVADAGAFYNEEDTPEAQTRRNAQKLFYDYSPHDFHEGQAPRFAKLPRLAYGRYFESFSFVTTNAGTLPMDLQFHPDSPWMPKSDVQTPQDLKVLGKVSYQRRTAIGQMKGVETVSGNQARRVGTPIAGVIPLTDDYPRVGFMAVHGAPGVHDIFRETDGSGRMFIDKAPVRQSALEWRISDMRFSGVPLRLTLYFFSEPTNVGDDSSVKCVIEDIKWDRLKEITVCVKHPEGEVIERQIVLCYKIGDQQIDREMGSIPNERLPLAGWLRLQLDATDHTPVTLTFSSPSGQRTDNIDARLLMLAPTGGNVWKAGLRGAVKLEFPTPRVTYLDFERWFANGDLFQRTFGVGIKDEGTAAGRFWSALQAAHAMRHLNNGLATWIDQLPDPAVDQVRLELMALDRLAENEPTAGAASIVEFSSKLKEFVKKHFDNPTPKSFDPRYPEKFVKDVLKPLNESFQFKVQLEAGDELALHGSPVLEGKVPAGIVAGLSVDVLVRAEHFEGQGDHPAVFHNGLKQYASRKVGNFLTFPADAIHIEAMYDDRELFVSTDDRALAIKLAERMVVAEGVERASRFNLLTDSAVPLIEGVERSQEELTRRWRAVGEVDTTTQQFRSGGRPIYHYIEPRKFRLRGESNSAEVQHPAMPLRLDEDQKLAQFELEAFFDRSDVDGFTVTQRLDPLGSRTKLREIDMSSAGAGYFRHRFTLRSRYAGAFADADRREVNAWPTFPKADLSAKPELSAHVWTHREAMLADLSRMRLTRPQLRALIPLTTAPGGEDATEPAPPVAAILQEPPFESGGLASRMAAEIKTGFGYGFVDADTHTHVEIRDSRKEAGPDPHLTYEPLKEDDALGLVLRAEGPMGLTFDPVNAPAPALPNSMLLLKPAALYGDRRDFQEFFLGVMLRRYIDPAWTIGGEVPEDPRSLDGERCWWIDEEVPQQQSPHDLLKCSVDNTDDITLLQAEADEDSVTLKTSKRLIDGVGGMTIDEVVVAKIARTKVEGLSVLHQPIAPGRYATAVFVRVPSARIERGESNWPLAVASFEWSPPNSKSVRIKTQESAKARLTMASAPTYNRWTRTSRDFDFVHLAPVAPVSDQQWKPQPVHVREMVADLDPSHKFVTFRRNGTKKPGSAWLVPSTFANYFPVEEHRHLALITSRFLKELGAPAEVFCRVSADPKREHQLVELPGATGLLPNEIYKPREDVVRVVEFATPAKIITNAHAVPETYQRAYFDLVATGFKLGSERQGQLRLYFRFVGKPEHVKKFTKITLRLSSAGSKKGHSLEIPLNNNGASHTMALELLLQRESEGGEKTKAVIRGLRSDGTVDGVTPLSTQEEQEELFELSDAGGSNAGFSVAVTEAQGGGEFWADVSLLHAPWTSDAARFDFDWLFSPSQEGEPVRLVEPAGLTSMVEAQASIVSVSPPIPIVSH
jgi:hypothetical protein